MTTTRYKTITAREANEANLVPVTIGYVEPEYEMLDRAIATLGDVPYSLVPTPEGIVIARPAKDVNKLKNEH
jgi:hypothetical protein